MRSLPPNNSDVILKRGTVISSYPALNTYLVLPEYSFNSDLVPCTALLDSSSMSAVGIVGSKSFTPGTAVYYIYNRSIDNRQVSKTSKLGLIVGPAPLVSIYGPAVDRFPLYNIYGVTDIDYFTQQITDVLLASKKYPYISTDRAYGLPIDILAGDSVNVGSFGSFTSLSSSYAGIGGGFSNRLEFFSFKNKARLTAENLEIFSPVFEAGYKPDWAGSWLFFNRKAALLSEGLGVNSVEPFTDADTAKSPVNLIKPAANEQQGIFRYERYYGNSVDGEWELWTSPELTDTGIRTWKEYSKPPLGLLSIKKSFSGVFNIRSVKGFSLIKSPFVPCVRELEPECIEPKFNNVEYKAWQDDPNNASVLPYYHHLASTLERFETDYNIKNYDNRLLRAKTDNWKLYDRAEIETAYSINREDYTTLEPLPEDKPEYPVTNEPKIISKDDNITGEQRVPLTEAMFKVLDDGTIILSDGYGAEIRLSRGGITITCPGDLRILPGRDFIEMTPRNRVINAGKDLYIQSANGSLYCKAERNASILSGNGADGGLLLLENRSKHAMSNNTWLKATDSEVPPINHGIIIKANKSLATVAEDVYLGIYDTEDSSDAGLKRKKAGRIVVDSAGGLLSLLGSECYAKFTNSVFMGAGSGARVSVLSVTNSGLACYTAGLLGIIANSITVGGGRGSIPVPELTATGIVNNNIPLTAGSASVKLDGSLACTKGVTVNGTVHASAVNAGNGRFGNGGRDYWGGGGTAPSPIQVSPLSSVLFGAASKSFEQTINPSANAVYTGKCIRDSGFFYPSTAQLKTKSIEFFGAKWQHMLKDANVWKEPVVQSPDKQDTMIWPGTDKWKDESLVILETDGILKDKSKLIERYLINCKQI